MQLLRNGSKNLSNLMGNETKAFRPILLQGRWYQSITRVFTGVTEQLEISALLHG